ncbi:MAG: hypothetical protein ACE5E5_10230 [Phycisphaerae bacterium]
MNDREQAEVRRATAQQRTPPGQPATVRIESGGIGLFPKDAPVGPLDLHLEATGPDGVLSVWLVDEWWTEVITHLPHPSVTIHIEPTPDALIHPVVLYQLAMLRRVCPQWRLVGHAYRDDLLTDEDFAALAKSHYHEVRFVDASRPGRPVADRSAGTADLAEVFSRIRRLAAGREPRHPTLVRVPAPALKSAPASRPAAPHTNPSRADAPLPGRRDSDCLQPVAKK